MFLFKEGRCLSAALNENKEKLILLWVVFQRLAEREEDLFCVLIRVDSDNLRSEVLLKVSDELFVPL